ncbi:hypothetical protein P7C73_g6035, partial [Tremellales sp. Uapishka_1]
MEYLNLSPLTAKLAPSPLFPYLHYESASSPLLQPGAAIESMGVFAEALQNTTGGTNSEWRDVIEEHFDEGSRFQLSLTSTANGLQMFDVPMTALPRVFITLCSAGLMTQLLTMTNSTEQLLWSPPSSPTDEASALPPNSYPRHGIQLDSEAEWVFEYQAGEKVVWKGESKSVWVSVQEEGVLKMESFEMVVQAWEGKNPTVGEWGLPPQVLRILGISEQLEDFGLIMQDHLEQGISPKGKPNAKMLIQDPPDIDAPVIAALHNLVAGQAEQTPTERSEEDNDE